MQLFFYMVARTEQAYNRSFCKILHSCTYNCCWYKYIIFEFTNNYFWTKDV